MSDQAALWIMVTLAWLAIIVLAYSRDNLCARVNELERRLGVWPGGIDLRNRTEGDER